jgi:hypothetical protein
MPATTFKAYIQSHNIKYRNQPIPVLHQNEPYVYLGIQLIPLLKWKTQQTITMNKLIKQTQLLLNSPTTLKQKLKMVDTIIRPGIAYSFYAVPYSMPNIIKLDQNKTSLQKAICGLPKSTPKITTKLPHDQYGLDAHSLKTEYLILQRPYQSLGKIRRRPTPSSIEKRSMLTLPNHTNIISPKT